MLIAAIIIRKPRVQRRCDGCHEMIEGLTLRLYGSGDREPPTVLYLHPQCTEWKHPKVIAAKAQFEKGETHE